MNKLEKVMQMVKEDGYSSLQEECKHINCCNCPFSKVLGKDIQCYYSVANVDSLYSEYHDD